MGNIFGYAFGTVGSLVMGTGNIMMLQSIGGQKMQYEVRTIKKVGVNGYESEMNNIIKPMADKGWTVQQILGSPDQGFAILFAKQN